ncbi:MAG TPA: 1,2-phenylacetyl-CoA epoxidase subunit PaaD [Gemmatimonadaceae bacterium]|nr:1,2-phenylacetyl-CoA epoxidase subunit PaaD [Gemmatimonadaceae bacterium]
MTARARPTREELLALLDTVKDPEVPVVSVVELGVVRDVAVEGDEIVVTITPTYSGCPAMREIEDEIVRALQAEGHAPVRVRTVFAPAWTTDWIGPAAREKLRAYGIAPPGMAPSADDDLVPLRRRRETVRCPYCDSPDTTLRSEFGSTACKSIRFCDACRQPFEQFKAI